MSEVNLVKRLFFVTAMLLVAFAAVACTRDKPAEPSPTTIVQNTTPVSPAGLPTSTSAAPISTTIAPATTEVPNATLPSELVTPTITLPTIPALPTVSATPSITTTTGAPGTYTVQWGDWLNKIAQQFGVTTQAIIAANPGLNPNRIYPGQVLNIPAPGTTPATPAPESTPVPGGTTPVPSTPPSAPGTYTVQRGDWFYAIARKFGISVPALLAANPGVNPNFVYPGQVLNIPGGDGPVPGPVGNTYTVQQGDTLFSIAFRFKTTTYALQIANHLANPNFIYPGQMLKIP